MWSMRVFYLPFEEPSKRFFFKEEIWSCLDVNFTPPFLASEAIATVADPGFSGVGWANSKLGLFCKFFCRKLHGNERIWTPGVGGVRASLPPPDPPMHCIIEVPSKNYFILSAWDNSLGQSNSLSKKSYGILVFVPTEMLTSCTQRTISA